MSDSDCQRCRGGGCEWCHNTGKAPTFRADPTHIYDDLGDRYCQEWDDETEWDDDHEPDECEHENAEYDVIEGRMRISRGQAELLKAEIHNILSLDLDRLTGSVVDAYTLAPNDEDAKREAVRASIERGIKP